MTVLRKIILSACVLALFLGAAPAALGHWDDSMPYKWLQYPDLSELGMDVDATVAGSWPPQVLADDFLCTTTGWITGIHIWGSWYYDYWDDPTNVVFTLSIHRDIPAYQSPTGYSMPGELVWSRQFWPGEFEAEFYSEGPEGYYVPCLGYFEWQADYTCWLYNFWLPEDELWQEGTAAEPVVYWLDVQAWPLSGDPTMRFGWKTSLEHNIDAAVWVEGSEPVPPEVWWNMLVYPPEHEYPGEPVDLAFVITGGAGVDWGDAPDNWPAGPGYPTLAGNNGASHMIGGPWLGPIDDSPDPEPDGQPDLAAFGDDMDLLYPPANDDEDGVSILPLVQGQTNNINFEVNGGGGQVNIWIDWNGDMDWDDAGEKVEDNWYGDGVHTLAVTPPVGSVVGQTFLRARISTAGSLPPGGAASDGEVEDHEVWIEQATQGLDFGDAPDPTYPTLLASDGARHIIGGPYFCDAAGGDAPDADPDGQPTAAADGDDNDADGDDEDGVTFPILQPLVTANIVVNVCNAAANGAVVQIWVDFNNSGSWQTSEEVFNGLLPDGVYNIPVTPPPGAVLGTRFARCRISSAGGLSPTGQASDGEVEDHAVQIEENPAIKWMQLPDLSPNGIDIKVDDGRWMADDFECTSYGPITDVHLWGSWKYDEEGEITNLHLSIHSDDPCGPNGYSEPNKLLWWKDFYPDTDDFKEYVVYSGIGEYWWDPVSGELIWPGDFTVLRIDINIPVDEAFVQDGDPCHPVIYWLDVRVETATGEFGWKTRRWPEHYKDDAVFHGGELPFLWKELRYPNVHPYEGNSVDMAFVITGEEWERPKEPVPNLKWSQPPIEIDPSWDVPTYCGWDEPSWREWVDPMWFDCWDCRTQCHGDADCDGDVDADDEAILLAALGGIYPNPPYDECADFDRNLSVDAVDLGIYNNNVGPDPPADCGLRPELTAMVADDFRCLGTMPIESIHWYGSYINWTNPEEPPPELPIGWRIGFWSNDASGQNCDFLYGAATGTTSGNAPSDLYKIDPSTGVATLIGPIGFNGVTGLSFAPDGTLYGTCHDTVNDQALLITIDTTTGAGALVGPVNTTGTGQRRVPDISFRSNGVLYGYGDFPEQLITIDTATGQGTAVGPTGYGGGGKGMDFAPNDTLYATPYDWQSLVIIDPATGAGSDVAGTAGNVPFRVNALEFCQQHGVLHGSWKDVNQNSWLVTLDLNTGSPLTTVATVQGLDAIAFNEYSRPKELLHVFEVDASRVEIEPVGMDYYYDFYPSDSCWQYYVKLEPNEVFWQNEYLDRTEDGIFWLSITALYPESDPPIDPQCPWGWKTRPWSWMDDAVRFWLYEAPAPGSADPCYLEPIKDRRYDESFDVAFELDTDPNYIKWEQPFTGIRHWPHYEDELSMAMATEETKYRQDPNPDGWDVGADVTVPLELADDWLCDETGTVDDIHFWFSWYMDDQGYIYSVTVKIYSDNPSGPFGSEPDVLQWSRTFYDDEFSWVQSGMGVQGWYDPYMPFWTYPDHYNIYYLSIDEIDDPFPQEQGNIYWLSIEMERENWPGWKTTYEVQNDFAVWRTAGGVWLPVTDDSGMPLDFAFELTTKSSEWSSDRLVADDWPCEANTPITACVWWGSYLGYGYGACQDGAFMPLPVPPDYFLLTMWDDVPLTSGASDNCCFPHPWTGCDDLACEASVCSYDPYCCDTQWDSLCAMEARSDLNCDCGGGDLLYSHPNEAIWQYEAYDYDEVLVGYDKYPHGEPNEPVFRYSVRLPEEAWFCQEEPNGVYWFSVVAVYRQWPDDYPWGWTNHKHVYMDDAVAGTVDPTGGWIWQELYDQTGMSEDMSFQLFTEPDCFDSSDPNYNQWVLQGKPKAWCCPYHKNGDMNGDGFININDVLLIRPPNFNRTYPEPLYDCRCDIDHNGFVNINDLLPIRPPNFNVTLPTPCRNTWKADCGPHKCTPAWP